MFIHTVSAQQLESVSSPRTLRVGVYNFKPLVFIDQNKLPSGLYVDILNYIGEQHSWQLNYIFCSWSDCLQQLKSGHIDLLPAIGYSLLRAEVLDYSDDYLYLDWAIVYRRKNEYITNILDLDGERISSIRGGLYTENFYKLLEEFGISAQVKEYSEFSQVIGALLSGESDAAILGNRYASLLERQYPQIEPTQSIFSPTKIFYAVPKDKNQDILAKLNEGIKQLKDNKGSFYYQSLSHWLGNQDGIDSGQTWFIYALTIAVTIIFLTLILVMLLKRQIANKTVRLKQSKKQFDKMVASAMDAIIGIDADYRIRVFNPAACKMFHVLENQVLQQPFGDLLPSRFHHAFHEEISSLCEQKTHTHLSQIPLGLRSTNEEFPIEISLACNLENPQICFTLIIRDISQRKQLEDEIRHTANYLQFYRNQTPIAAINWNDEYEVVDWNPAAEKLFGYKREEIIGKSLLFLLPDNAATNAQSIWEYLSPASQESAKEVLAKDGRMILTEWHNAITWDRAGNTTATSSLVLDITDEYQLKQELLRREAEQREILNSMAEAVITIDETGRILTFNHAAEQLFGYTSQEMIGEKVNLLMPNPHCDKHDEYIQEYLTTGQAKVIGCATEVEGINKDKQKVPVRLSLAELPRQKEQKRRFIGTCQDLSLLKKQQEQLIHSQKMDALGKLTGGVAHDFNNTLSVISGFTELLELKCADDESLMRYLKQISAAVIRGKEMTANLLSFSRNRPGKSLTVNINDLIEKNRDMLAKSLTSLISLSLQLCDTPHLTHLDEAEFENALLNLTINARHAMPDGGELVFSTRNVTLTAGQAENIHLPINDYLLLQVRDNGTGMDKETLSQIFEPFFSTKGEDGTGLGLSQVFGFIQRCNGTIVVNSEQGEGTTFDIYFPKYTEKGRENSPRQNDKPVNLRGNESILVVDDEAKLLTIYKEYLTAYGYRVLTCHSPKKVFGLLEQFPDIDLLVSDIVMPEIDGISLSQQIIAKYPDLKIQFVSGYANGYSKSYQDHLLIKNLLAKPFTQLELLKKIREVLDNPQLDKKITAIDADRDNRETLNPIQWKEDYATGMLDIDEEHQTLIKLINQCIDIINGGGNNSGLGTVLYDLQEYTRYHFNHEEQIMGMIAYPDLEEHQISHKKLIHKVKKYIESFHSNQTSARSILDFLSEWLTDHIVKQDKAIGPYYRKAMMELQTEADKTKQKPGEPQS